MRTLVVSMLALVACGGGSDTEPGLDASTVDGAAHPLVGTWAREPFSDVDRTTVVSFTDQGVLHWGADSGTWSVTTSGELETGAPPTKPMATAPFYLSLDRKTLMMEAMFPTTPTDGLVGTWAGDFTYSDGTSMTTTMAFRADQTLTWSDTQSGATRTDDGTWTIEDGSNVIIQAMLNGTTPVTVATRLIPDVVLGGDLMTKTE